MVIVKQPSLFYSSLILIVDLQFFWFLTALAEGGVVFPNLTESLSSTLRDANDMVRGSMNSCFYREKKLKEDQTHKGYAHQVSVKKIVYLSFVGATFLNLFFLLQRNP